MGKGKVKPFQALKGQPNFTSCSKYSKIVCSMNLPREGDVVNSYLVVIVGYALFLILLGYGIGKHVKGASDFFVGGRSFSWKLLFTTLIAANIGAGSTVGVTGLAYRHGVSSWWWIGCSGLGSLILAYVVGPAVWRVAKRYDLFYHGRLFGSSLFPCFSRRDIDHDGHRDLGPFFGAAVGHCLDP